MKRLLTPFFFFLACFPAEALQQARHEIDTCGFTQELQAAWEDSKVPSANFGFISRDGQYFSASFGPAVWSEEEALNPDHIFRLASMTKAVTGVAVLQLWERGLVELDESVNKILPEIDSIPILSPGGLLTIAQKPITLRHLLTHTSGFSYAMFDDRLSKFEISANWPHRDYPRVAEAGDEWIYSTGFDWAGRVVEAVSGTNLEDYFRKHITGPLSMNHTWFNVPDSLQHLIVSFGTRSEDLPDVFQEFPGRIPDHPITEYNGGGGLFGSMNDYLRFLACILNGGTNAQNRILKQETVEMIFRDELPSILKLNANEISDPGRMEHSLTWAIEPADSDFGRTAGTAYWSGYFNTFYSVDQNSGIAVVLMANYLPFLDPAILKLYKKFELIVRGE